MALIPWHTRTHMHMHAASTVRCITPAQTRRHAMGAPAHTVGIHEFAQSSEFWRWACKPPGSDLCKHYSTLSWEALYHNATAL